MILIIEVWWHKSLYIKHLLYKFTSLINQNLHIMSLKKQFVKSRKKCKVTFQLPIKATNGGTEVKVVGDFNDWSWEKGIPMKVKKDAFVAETELPMGQSYQFRYLIDAREWENEWDADNYISTPFGVENSVVESRMEEMK